MSEIERVLTAYARARAADRDCALATVMSVEGSSYRRVGARMLVADDGEWVGCVSGGCLERDLLRKAAWSIERRAPLLATYDTREDGDGPARTPGAGLGCNGVIGILVEPIPAGTAHGVLDLIADCRRRRRTGGIILFPPDAGQPAQTWVGDQPLLAESLPEELRGELRRAWLPVQARRIAAGALCTVAGRPQPVLIEPVLPALQVVVIGAGHDAVAMAALGVHLGYAVTVVDLRSAAPIPRGTFAGIAQYVHCPPAELAQRVALDARSAVIVMTHQAQDDLAVLPGLLAAGPAYLGLLGPRKRAVRLMAECGQAAALTAAHVHAPVGLDIGAETPEEIALAVFAEIQAAMRGGTGAPLRDRHGPIHARGVG